MIPLFTMRNVIGAMLLATPLTVALHQMQRVPEIPALADSTHSLSFNDAWLDSMKVLALADADSQRTAAIAKIATTIESKSVVTERVLADVSLSMPSAAPSPEEDKPLVVRRRRHVETNNRRDICQRHGLKKVFTRGGRSWRCRK